MPPATDGPTRKPIRSRVRRALTAVARGAARLAVGIGIAVVVGWALGRVLSDRFAWSQWLLWIPTPALSPAIVLLLIGSAGVRRGQRWLVRGGLAAAAVGAVFFVFVEHHLLRDPAPAEGLTVVHWNLTHDDRSAPGPAPIDRVMEVAGDITILVDAYPPSGEIARQVLEQPKVVGRFIVLTHSTRSPLVEARPIVSIRHKTRHDKKAREHPKRRLRTFSSEVLLLRFDCRATLGRELTVYAVDLPSDPFIPRAAIARRVRRLLDEADEPPPDLVVGDFNITRDSASMEILFPQLRHAYDEAGHGYAATFHRRFPLYHIDHVLVADTIDCTRYDLVDPLVGRHFVQRATVTIQSPSPDR